MAERADVVVVGGGPAGAACALGLARRGVAVTIVERARFPRRKPCGEYLSGGAVAALDELGLGRELRLVAQPLRGVRLVPAATAALELPFPSEALALGRAILDTVILGRALAAGARLVQGRAEDLRFERGRAAGVVVRDEAGERTELRARFVVGADGNGSLVARKLELVRPLRGTRRFAIGGHYRGLGDFGGFVEMYVGPGAYFALNPLDSSRTNVMVVVRDRALGEWAGAVDENVRGKAAELGRGHRSFEGAERIGARVAVGPLAFSVRAPAAPGALLVGDAAGVLNPFTGQGVFLALRGGIDAAATLGAALAEPGREAEYVAAYAARRGRDFAARRRLSKLVDLLLDVPFLTRRAAARLRSFPKTGEALMAALGGTLSPERALAPPVLGRLLL
jgi:2-polyprenyl-6-methoxyphenol hydroxylase-like FAD-dependent oxidoreductase